MQSAACENRQTAQNRSTTEKYVLQEGGVHLHPRARSIGLIRIRTPPFSDEAFDWAQLNPDESSEFIQLIRKKYGWVRMTLTRAHTRYPREDVKVLRLPQSDLNRTVAQRNAAHLISSCERRRWMSLPNPDERTRPKIRTSRTSTRSHHEVWDVLDASITRSSRGLARPWPTASTSSQVESLTVR